MVTPDVFCDVCDNNIYGPVYFRGDVVACKTCANQIDSKVLTYRFTYIVLFPLAVSLTLVVLFVQMVPFLAILLSMLAAVAFVVGAFNALS